MKGTARVTAGDPVAPLDPRLPAGLEDKKTVEPGPPGPGSNREREALDGPYSFVQERLFLMAGAASEASSPATAPSLFRSAQKS